jgi:hypothetical protein
VLACQSSNPLAREHWIEVITTVAAYRDRWGIDDARRSLGSQGAARTIEAINQHDLAPGCYQQGGEAHLRPEGITPSQKLSLSTSGRLDEWSCERAVRWDDE